MRADNSDNSANIFMGRSRSQYDIAKSLKYSHSHMKIFMSKVERDHKMDKKLKVSEIVARTGLVVSTVSRVLAGKRIPAPGLARGYWSARELGVMEDAAGRMLLNNLGICPSARFR